MKSTAPGFGTFLALWCGQVVSLVGSGLSRFALGVWVYQETGSATQFSLILLASSLPVVVLSLISGPMVDRWDRRRTMIASDTLAALPTLVLAVLFFFDFPLALWQLFLAVSVSAASTAFQWPAYAAATTLLVPRERLARAAGMLELARAGAQILAPMLAGVLMLHFDLWSVLLLDTLTFLFAVSMLLVLHIPAPPRSAEGTAPGASLWREAKLGWHYIFARPGLVRLLAYFAFLNFSIALVLGLTTPMMLSFTDSAHLGFTLSAGALGMFLGGLALTVWGGPRKKVLAVLGFGLPLGAGLFLAGVRPDPLLITAGLFLFNFSIPIINGCSQAIWQTRTPADLQGRVFSIRRMLASFTVPLGYLVAGPLAEFVFAPLLVAGGPLAESVGTVIGVGPGRGIALIFLLQGVFTVVIAGLGFSSPRLMQVEEELPVVAGTS